MLFVESAEGGAGVLRRLVEEPGALARAARRALEICHFDPDSDVDHGLGDSDREGCARACYDCLLSYRNQGHHLLIDRHLARDALLACAKGETHKIGAVLDPLTAWERTRLAVEHDPPRRAFVEWLAEREYRCPDEVSPELPSGARPDLVYRLRSGPVAVFVPGPNGEERPGCGGDAEDDLRDQGWGVITVPAEGYADVVARFSSVFGTSGRTGR